VSFFLKHLQRWIDRARARRIAAAGQVFDGTDQLIAVAWLFVDQSEQCQAQFTLAEHPSATLAPLGAVLPVAAAARTTAIIAIFPLACG